MITLCTRLVTILFFMGAGSCLTLHATTGRSSEEGDEKPLRNYFGTVEDVDGNNFNVEYIALRSPTSTSKISVFMKPTDITVDPRRNTSYLNLQDITEIRVENSQPLRIKNVDYVTMTVRFKGNKQVEHEYIIEAHTRLWCSEVDTHPSIRKELQLSAVKRIIIAGFRSADLYQRTPSKKAPEQTERKKQHLCTKAATDVHKLQKLVDKLPTSDQKNAQEYVQSLQDCVGGICSGT